MGEQPITDALRLAPFGADPSTFHWHVWRKVGRTIYVQLGAEPSDDDPLIGVMDTPRLANEAVDSHNATLQKVQRG